MNEDDVNNMIKMLIEANKKMLRAHNNLVRDLETFKVEISEQLENINSKLSSLTEE